MAGVRLGGAVVVLAGPVVLGAVLLSILLITGVLEQGVERRAGVPYVALAERPSQSGLEAVVFLWRVTAVVIAQSVQWLLILVVMGARRRAEAHVGLSGAVLALPWIILGGLHLPAQDQPWGAWLGAVLPQAMVIHFGYSGEQGSYGDLFVAARVWTPLALNLLVLAALAAWFCRRYGTCELGGRREQAAAARRQRSSLLSPLPIRLPGRWGALAWLDLRQAVPLAVAGLALAGLIAVVTVVMESPDRLPSTTELARQLPYGPHTWRHCGRPSLGRAFLLPNCSPG